MTKSFLCVLGFLVIFGCHKSDNPTTPVVTVDYNEIYLDSFHRVVKVISTAGDHEIKWISDYSYSDTLIILKTSFPDSSLSISRYKPGQNGYAESSTDTSFYHDQFWADVKKYYYDSAGYLYFWESNNNPCYFYEKDGDLMMLNSEKYSYYDMLNKIDIFWHPYYNGIVGKIYKHLIREINGYYGLGAFKISSFSYSLDSGGYIIEKNETRNIGNTTQHISNFEYYQTRYTYIFNYVP